MGYSNGPRKSLQIHRPSLGNRRKSQTLAVGVEFEERPELSLWRCKGNLLALSISCILVYSAFKMLQNLFTTVYASGDVNDATGKPVFLSLSPLAVMYSTMSLSCLCIPFFTLNFSAKLCFSFSIASAGLWCGAQFFPNVYLQNTFAVLQGFGQSVGWNAQLMYLSRIFHVSF